MCNVHMVFLRIASFKSSVCATSNYCVSRYDLCIRRGDDDAEEVPEEEDISVAAPLDSARSGGVPAGSRSARDDSVAEVSLAGHAEDESEDVSLGADYAEPIRPQTRK